MWKWLVGIVIICVAAFAIYEQYYSLNSMVSAKGTKAIAIGEKASALGASITPIEVVSDTRCPAPVQCLIPGEIDVRVKIDSNEGIKEDKVGLIGVVILKKELIRLKAVEPQAATDKISQKDYRFQFEIRRLSPSEI